MVVTALDIPDFRAAIGCPRIWVIKFKLQNLGSVFRIGKAQFAMASDYSFSFYNVSFPDEYVLHAGMPPLFTSKIDPKEINRPQSLNAFSSEYFHSPDNLR
jgi:hypothetical protein